MSMKFYEENGFGKSHSAYYPKRLEISADITGPSMTRQEFSDECDVNAIMARFEKSGIWPMQPNGAEPIYYDFTDMPDLQGAMSSMIEAETAFMRLPAAVRKEFDNDALRFVEYAQDGNNLPKLREWGLADPEKIPDAPMRVEVVNDNRPAPGDVLAKAQPKE